MFGLANAHFAVVIALHFAVRFVQFVFAGLMSAVRPRRAACDDAALDVVVIGGGIAGCGAAYTLSKSGRCASVTLLEPRATLGGNAKTNLWWANDAEADAAVPTREDEASGRAVRTGLSVLAWPRKYFRHYKLLLAELGVATTEVVPKFFISADGELPTFKHGSDNPRWERDMQRWDRAVRIARCINDFCARWNSRICGAAEFVWFGVILGGGRFAKPRECAGGDGQESLYDVVLWNPLNLLPARTLCTIVGVSGAFWHNVVVPVYSSSFLTTALDQMPACILPALDSIISVGDAERLRPLDTWKESSKVVFDRIAARIGAANVLTGAEVTQVEFDKSLRKWFVHYRRTPSAAVLTPRQRPPWPPSPAAAGVPTAGSHYHSGADDTQCLSCDRVVFACPATVVDRLTKNERNVASGFRSAIFEAVVPHVRYEDERDDAFTKGLVHTDRALALPPAVRDSVICEGFSNYIQLHGPSVENVFVLGTWVPAAIAARRTPTDVHDFYVSYGARAEVAQALNEAKVAVVDNTNAHPQFTPKTMLLAMAASLLQGRCGAYFCASWATPGNGHDLSLLSGVVVASEITGGYYPFERSADSATRRDFNLMRKMMLAMAI